MLFLLAAVLVGSSASWAQTRDLEIPTNTETNGQWNGSDKYTYTVNFSGIGDVKAVFSGITSGSDRVNGSVLFKLSTELNITVPSGYNIKYVKLDFTENKNYQFSYNYSDIDWNSSRNYSEWTAGTGVNLGSIRIANRANMTDHPSSDVVVSKITIRIHKAPTVSISSDKVITTTLNEAVTLSATITGGEADNTFGVWHLYNSNTATGYDDNNFLGYSNNTFTFTPSQGVKKDNSSDVLKQGYAWDSNPYYIGVCARQNCIGGNGWENSDPQVYTVRVGVRVTANVSPAGLVAANDFTIHQRNEPTWTIKNGDIVAHQTTAVFTAPTVENYDFVGWYEGENLKSSDVTYDFGNVGSDLVLTAKYKKTNGTLPANLDDNLIKQPVYGAIRTDMAKEYIAFAHIKTSNDQDVSPSWTYNHKLTGSNYIQSTETLINGGTQSPTKIGYIFGSNQYNADRDNGLCFSQHGKAGVEEGQTEIPARGTLVFSVAGTEDFFILLKNNLPTVEGQPYGHDRRHIKVWYTNDQNLDASGKKKLMPFMCASGNTSNDYYFNGERIENSSGLVISVRLEHLGSDGTCEIYVTYEDVADENVWIKGVVVKRPDLDVTIGRTDKVRYVNGEPINAKNDAVTGFGENKPFYWNFNTSGFYAKDKDGNEVKKFNKYDGRTYLCGYDPDGHLIKDFLLVYSDGLGESDKASFDGRHNNGHHTGYDEETDWNEHIEFNHPTVYREFPENRRGFNPILSGGLKVNVTGSGWFTIACAAPNGPVKMKVLSSTNGGTAYINVLREFDVPQASSDVDWKEYKVYLKAHQEKNGSAGFWDGNVLDGQIDPEDTQMSLYVVFDKIEGETYKDGDVEADAQLNVHFLQWLNEEPVDYNFQREEDPKLLSEMQKVGNSSDPDFYWQMGTSLKENDYNTFNPNEDVDKKSGQESTYGKASTQYEGGKSKGYVWNVAAKAAYNAHTEAAYAGGNNFFTKEYEYDVANAANKLEFASPISGPFLRICSMKNNYIVAHFVQSREENGEKPVIYVLDETGKVVPYCPGADTFTSDNLSKFTTDARMRGCASYMEGLENTVEGKSVFVVKDNDEAFRIDFIAPAGKEFFICANKGALSLARLESLAWRVNNTPVPAINGSLTLTDGANNSDAIATAMSGDGRYAASVTLNRTFTAGKWASIVLPFSMNEEKFKKVFGRDAKCIHFTDVDKTTNTVHLTHHFYNMIVAGRPVFICPSSDGSIFSSSTITDVTLSAKTVTNTSTASGFTFFASYDNATMNKNDLYMNNNNAMKYLNVASKSYPGMRAFIKSPSDYDPSQPGTGSTEGAKAVFLNFDDSDLEDATGIEAVIAEEFGQNVMVVTKQTKVYDLNGRVVANGTDISNLPSGVYIVNGKKYVK